MNKEEIVIDENKCAIYKIYQETDEDVLNKKLYVFNNELGTIKEIMLYKSQLTEANSKIEKIREYFPRQYEKLTSEVNKIYDEPEGEERDYKESYIYKKQNFLLTIKEDILSIIEGDKK